MKQVVTLLLLGTILLWPLLAIPTSEMAWRPLAEQGDAEAQYNLGVMYDEDRTRRDAVEAVRWFRIAAEQGHIAAQYRLGVMYAEGEGVPEIY